MKLFLPPFASLLLVGLLFPGLSRAKYVNYESTEVPRESREESPRQRTKESYLVHHQVKRGSHPLKRNYLPPRTPPYEDLEPDFKIINCKKSEGFCQEYCNFMESQVGYCSKKKDACCVHMN
ncbi:sperm-associated antigen 11-like isoform X2 [Choloepus didactylus]|uniref:sperm-associated antigen 11-like isoform X2 n=1 Tax=Choloepus didactylus TaxID=27675 RepID=UPI00189EE615|nr:sperm-associated antigen 11-like isoform X2 [Choloepus didactylus]